MNTCLLAAEFPHDVFMSSVRSETRRKCLFVEKKSKEHLQNWKNRGRETVGFGSGRCSSTLVPHSPASHRPIF